MRAAAVIGVLIAVGLAAAAWLHGWQLRQSRLPGQTMLVKGLAEKPIVADSAEWRLTVNVKRKTAAEAVDVLRVERDAVVAFLTQDGFTGALVATGSESVDESFDERRGAGGSGPTPHKSISNVVSVYPKCSGAYSPKLFKF